MVEATNKVIKNNYLGNLVFDSVDEIQGYIDDVLIDYNSERPHGQLTGLTPDEAFAGVKPDRFRFRDAIAEARPLIVPSALLISWMMKIRILIEIPPVVL